MTKVVYSKDGRARSFAEEDLVLEVIRLNEAVTERFAAFMKRYKLTSQQLNVLRILFVRNEPTATGEVAARLLTRVPDVPRLLDRLESRGLVKRSTCGEDRRRTLVALTKKGEELVLELDPALVLYLSDLFASFPKSKVVALTKLLQEARASLPTD